MSEILSQAEVEKLLAELQNEQPETEDAPPAGPVEAPPSHTPAPRVNRTLTYEDYDFRRPDKFAKDQLRTLQMLHETFARLATSGLTGFLRTPVQVELISLEQVPYEEYLLSINKSIFTIISLPPLTGQAVIEIEFSLIFSILDRMLGGTGKGFSRTTLTDIERPLVSQILDRLFAALKSSWETLVMISPGMEGMETSAQFVQIAPRGDIVVTVLFEVKVGAQRGAMSLCIPYLVLKPITSKLSAQKWFQASERKTTQATKLLLGYHVNRVPVTCAVELGGTRITVRDFLRLCKGDILKLDQETGSDMTLHIGDVPKFYGRPALSGRKVLFTVAGKIKE